MAGWGEIDQTRNALNSSKQTEGVGDSLPSTSSLECAICLQVCMHPVRLPCHHVFCFLCVKGASWHSKRCALCRQEVPEGFLAHPMLLSPGELKEAAAGVSWGGGTGDCSRGDHAWYYEGHNGWWQYDERTDRVLEEAFAKGRRSAEMLIAGFLYVADLEHMVQQRCNARGRRRKMKRDVVGIPKKGVAGLRLDPEPAPRSAPPAVAAAAAERVMNSHSWTQFAGVGDVVSAPPQGRPPTVLGSPLARLQSPPPPPSLEESLSHLFISQPEEYEFASGGGEGERPNPRMPGEELGETMPDRMPPRGSMHAPVARMDGAQ